ncbi:hypothetical protein [Ectobacillus panaciterrae]|uniref:hypothetical protein n=1 Tax=Ectobacillus panaciterrae TaxID=363872 RepID=UPI000422A238|nr:hypothetical protein [Ectobacillus panaciterrae]
MFRDELRTHVGSLVQLVTAVEVVNGILLAVTDDMAVVRTSGVPSYGSPEDVMVRIPVISYVRLFS